MRNYEKEEAAVKAAIAEFPGEFHLPPPHSQHALFTIVEGACFWSRIESCPMLYLYIKATPNARWEPYCKGTAKELKKILEGSCP